MKPMRFTNAEINMAGNLFSPESVNEAARYPAIVIRSSDNSGLNDDGLYYRRRRLYSRPSFAA
ncbi:TPA: hypothetical protein ACGT9I_001354 [Salmonella enterica]